MKVSRNWLQRFFDTPLPDAPTLERALTFHSSEIEDTEEVGEDTVFDVKVLPDKSAWLLSHRGVARELSVILGTPLSHDPLLGSVDALPVSDTVAVVRHTDSCTRYSGVIVKGVTVKPSPPWLQQFLSAIGQRPINNVVDATNFVMFSIGQPLHAFDLKKIGTKDGKAEIGVRMAREGETITTLTGDSYTLSQKDMLIVDSTSDTPIGIAGIKGGKAAEVDAGTTDIFIESAHFDRTTVRLSSQRLRLRTDASSRFENGLVPHLTLYGAREVAALITEIASGTIVGYVDDGVPRSVPSPVSVSRKKINAVLGLSMTDAEITAIFDRFGYPYTVSGDVYTVTPPFERDDLLIPEDIIEEVGRMYGLEHIESVSLSPLPLGEINNRFYHTERIRRTLVALGFSEVYTSSFRDTDTVKLENSLAADKGYLRSSLVENVREALDRNAPHRDLLGLSAIKIFEIGTVFPSTEREMYSCAIGVRTELSYKEKKDMPLLREAQAAIEKVVGKAVSWTSQDTGIASFDVDALITELPSGSGYDTPSSQHDAVYRPFSPYPFVSRDIALWAPSGVASDDIRGHIAAAAGDLLVRTTLFDVFEKEGKTSYAFRLIFQSYEKTLTDADANAIMDRIVSAVGERGWVVR